MRRAIPCLIASIFAAGAFVVLGDAPPVQTGQDNQNYTPPVRPKGFHARITIRTVDEDGNVVPGVAVDAEFPAWNKWKGSTDTNGLFVVDGEAGVFEVFWRVNKEGYYSGRGKFEFQKVANGSWQPWSPIATQLVRRIMNPVPMYAKKVATKIPKTNTDLGFDFTVGDWVSPYGKGHCVDVIFGYSNRVSGVRDFEGRLALTFPNVLDGICENSVRFKDSWFTLPRYAPDQGYATNWFAYICQTPLKGRHGEKTDAFLGGNAQKSYFVRVRSKVDENGKLEEAHYAKIVGEIEASGIAGPWTALAFTYYINPTPNDRNMEFDPKKNLLQNLTGLEQVHEP